MRPIPMYEVWWSDGHGIQLGPRFRFLKDALSYTRAHTEISVAIRQPDGTWHKWETGDRILPARRRNIHAIA